jgi:hypothetical protein
VLLIQIAKQPDSSTLLRCTRADGSVTWQKQTKHAAHFVLHDLTHYAVETTFGYTQGFWGLISAGWDIDDTTGKGKRGAIPPEALEVEKIVGLFDSERAMSALCTSDEFNQYAPRPLAESDIDKVRALRATLFKQWFNLPAGEKLELQWPGPSA